jgi:hypothetical protein
MFRHQGVIAATGSRGQAGDLGNKIRSPARACRREPKDTTKPKGPLTGPFFLASDKAANRWQTIYLVAAVCRCPLLLGLGLAIPAVDVGAVGATAVWFLSESAAVVA